MDGGRYASKYDLVIEKVEKVVSDDNIFEPGESMQISMMEVRNCGAMHTPVN